MEQVKARVVLVFSEALRPFLDIRALLRAAQGAGSKAQVEGQPLVIIRAKDRHKVQLQVRGLVVEQEASDSGELRLGDVDTSLEALYGSFEMPTLMTARLDALWIEPYELPFHELVARMHGRLMAQNDLTSAATDIAVVVDNQVDDQKTEHLQIGPMMPPQLNDQFLAFAREKLPEQFIFCATGWTLTAPSVSTLASLMSARAPFGEWAKARAEQVANMVKG